MQHANIEHADNVNIDMTGAVKSALDFVGDQTKESRQHKKEMFRMKAENEKQFFATFFKFFGIFAIVVIILWVILRNFM